MPVSDLSNVTSTLMTLIQENVKQSLQPGLDILVTPQPPEQVGSSSLNTISLHLYHVAEDPAFKNLPGPGTDAPNVAKVSMALNLYYIITAHHYTPQADVDADFLTRQKLTGYVLKTLHDFPVITYNTRIGSTYILQGALHNRGNRLQIIFRPVSVDEAVSFWSSAASDEKPTTAVLSAYYEVRVVLLEPEEPKVMPGTVLSLGAYPVQIGTPYLERSISTISFTLPARSGGMARSIEASPARVSQLPPPPPPPPSLPFPQNNRFRVEGVNLTGRHQSLIFRNNLWTQLPTPVDEDPIDEVIVNEDPAWIQSFDGEVIEVDVHGQIQHNGATLNVLPGFYTAFVRVVNEERVILNELKQITAVSNEIGFIIIPRITGNTIIPDNRIRVNVENAFNLTDPQLDERIVVVVAGKTYERADAFVDDPMHPEYNERKFTVSANDITFERRFDTGTSGDYPFRLIVNGAESQPYWIEI